MNHSFNSSTWFSFSVICLLKNVWALLPLLSSGTLRRFLITMIPMFYSSLFFSLRLALWACEVVNAAGMEAAASFMIAAFS
jgi:hypothetical protein